MFGRYVKHTGKTLSLQDEIRYKVYLAEQKPPYT
jgi:hypothetical protein